MSIILTITHGISAPEIRFKGNKEELDDLLTQKYCLPFVESELTQIQFESKQGCRRKDELIDEIWDDCKEILKKIDSLSRELAGFIQESYQYASM